VRELTDRHKGGLLSQEQFGELETLVGLSESLSLVRGTVLHLLGREER